jgi:hypothetical protein
MNNPVLWREIGLDCVVRIATRYELDGTGSNPGGAGFSAVVQTGPEAHPASETMGTQFFPTLKRPGHGVDHTHPI